MSAGSQEPTRPELRALGPGVEDAAAEVETTEGARIGRYFLLSRLGQGGVGVVHLGYDPELHRRVAIKVLRTSTDPAARERMVREARALAQVSHPNLVHVYEVGTWGEHVFLAMEYVRGRSLAQRVAEGPVPWREAVALMVRAGRGLAAAHRAGLVHRDFKPGNVLLGEDGSVRVADFGLARLEADSPVHDSDDLGATKAEARRRALARTFSADGAVLGTPAYMAPEQHAGGTLDARSDIYSFCVTLHEVLAGARPFRGSRSEIVKGKLASAPSLPAEVPAPAWLRRAVARGLAPNADQRHASMTELLAELDAGRHRRRRWIGVSGVGVVAAALGVWAFAVPRAVVSCDPPVTAWGERKAEVQGAFAGVTVPHAATSLAFVEQRLDAHAAAWQAMYREACEATHVEGRQSGEMLDLRMACLERRSAELSALVEVLAAADAAVVERSIMQVAALPALDGCADADALRAQVPLPEGPGKREQLADLEQRLRQATAIVEAGKRPEAIAALAPMLAEARELGWAPLSAEVLLQLALAHADDPAESEVLLREAIVTAAEGKADDVAARAWIKLVQVVGADQGRHDAAGELVTAARAAVARAGAAPGLEADLEGALGRVEFSRGRYEAAIDRYRRAERLVVESLGEDDPRLRTILTNHGAVLAQAGRSEEAREQLERALEHGVRTLGADHPYVADYHARLAAVLSELGRDEEAQEHYRRALEILRREPDRNERRIATVETNLAVEYLRTGSLDEARTAALRAIPVLQAAPGAGGGAAAAAIDVLGLAASVQGELDAAASAFQRALDLLAVTRGKKHPSHAEVALHLAQVRIDQGRLDEAGDLVEAARATLDATAGPGHPGSLLAAAVHAEVRAAEGKAGEEDRRALRAFLDAPHARDRWQRARMGAALARLLEEADPPDPVGALELRRRAAEDGRAVGASPRIAPLATAGTPD